MVNKELCDQFLEEQWDSMVWSYSRVSSYAHCPYTWYETYVLGNRKGNFYAYAGSAYHKVMEDFYNFCKRNNWEMDKTKTGNLIKQLDCFEKEIRKELKGGMPRLIQIKTMKKQEASVSQVAYQEDHF